MTFITISWLCHKSFVFKDKECNELWARRKAPLTLPCNCQEVKKRTKRARQQRKPSQTNTTTERSFKAQLELKKGFLIDIQVTLMTDHSQKIAVISPSVRWGSNSQRVHKLILPSTNHTFRSHSNTDVKKRSATLSISIETNNPSQFTQWSDKG